MRHPHSSWKKTIFQYPRDRCGKAADFCIILPIIGMVNMFAHYDFICKIRLLITRGDGTPPMPQTPLDKAANAFAYAGLRSLQDCAAIRCNSRSRLPFRGDSIALPTEPPSHRTASPSLLCAVDGAFRQRRFSISGVSVRFLSRPAVRDFLPTEIPVGKHFRRRPPSQKQSNESDAAYVTSVAASSLSPSPFRT